ncbi:MAG TPA: hypothetical protein PLV70_00500 [Flavobacteriales bacterium]|nr:hypothetical protein [Flavobacteriales bacterium]HRP80389.1 hypothetical protein [Flavobacteriales bacterium]HRQ83572.1 hypothetical protein [Flavobacteriales bacterium]
MRALPFNGLRGVVALVAMTLGAMPAQAQLLDSLAFFTRQPPRFVAKLDTRGSFISNSSVRLIGVKAGLEHAGRFQYGLGWSFLGSRVEHEAQVDGLGLAPVHLRMAYLTPYVEYDFFQRGPWEARIPVQIGIGSVALVHSGTDGRRTVLQRSFLLAYEPAMTIQYRFLRYFGLHAGWGYRLVLVKTDVGESLTAPIYLLGMKVFIGDLWRDHKR